MSKEEKENITPEEQKPLTGEGEAESPQELEAKAEEKKEDAGEGKKEEEKQEETAAQEAEVDEPAEEKGEEEEKPAESAKGGSASGGIAEKEQKQEEKKWFVIQTLTGQEDRVKTSIERNIKEAGLEGKVFSILVPEEDTVEIKKGKRVEKKKKMFPGYVFIEMILDESSWYTIRQTPGVARFIGSKTHPIPVVDREMQRVLKQLGVREEKIEVAFEKGETIRIISGPFRGYTGTVEEINVPKEKIKAFVNIFGRDTPVEIDFEQAEKVV